MVFIAIYDFDHHGYLHFLSTCYEEQKSSSTGEIVLKSSQYYEVLHSTTERCFSHNSACAEVDKSWSSTLKNRDETAKGN